MDQEQELKMLADILIGRYEADAKICMARPDVRLDNMRYFQGGLTEHDVKPYGRVNLNEDWLRPIDYPQLKGETLPHEIAHWVLGKGYGHGTEWQETFKLMKALHER